VLHPASSRQFAADITTMLDQSRKVVLNAIWLNFNYGGVRWNWIKMLKLALRRAEASLMDATASLDHLTSIQRLEAISFTSEAGYHPVNRILGF
jgi:hypothetical protein